VSISDDPQQAEPGSTSKSAVDEDEDAVDDDAEFTAGDYEAKDVIQPRWPTRVFAAVCLRKIIDGECSHRM